MAYVAARWARTILVLGAMLLATAASGHSLVGKWEGLEAGPFADGKPSWTRGFGYEFRGDGTARTHVYWHPRYTPTAGERRYESRVWRYTFSPPTLEMWRRGERVRFRVRLRGRTLVLERGGLHEPEALSRVDRFKFEERPNQAMQLTASKSAVYALGGCRRERLLRFMHRGLAAADLVPR